MFYLDWILSFSCIECGRTFQENSASFTSPSYYSSTPSAEPESCEWRITATHGEKIVLNITDLVRIHELKSFQVFSFEMLIFTMCVFVSIDVF